MPPMLGLQLNSPIVDVRCVSRSVRAPVRAAADAASHPACPPPTTITSYDDDRFIYSFAADNDDDDDDDEGRAIVAAAVLEEVALGVVSSLLMRTSRRRRMHDVNEKEVTHRLVAIDNVESIMTAVFIVDVCHTVPPRELRRPPEEHCLVAGR
jgi:hypothetical protein